MENLTPWIAFLILFVGGSLALYAAVSLVGPLWGVLLLFAFVALYSYN